MDKEKLAASIQQALDILYQEEDKGGLEYYAYLEILEIGIDLQRVLAKVEELEV